MTKKEYDRYKVYRGNGYVSTYDNVSRRFIHEVAFESLYGFLTGTSVAWIGHVLEWTVNNYPELAP